jgi:two-component system sensor histidine kinase UhpB
MALAPLGQLAREMEEVDLLRPTQRLPVVRDDEIGRVVATFNRMLGRLEGERREGARRILAAQEAERIGIAHNLHDEVGQVLTAVLLHLDSIGEQAPAHRAEIDEVRRISSSLRPELLEQLGLVSALTELTREFSRASGIRVTRRFERSLPNLDPDAELAIYRIVQESLTNVARHARAARVTATLEQSRDHIVVRVVDDGQGFGAGPEEHGGVRSIRERALLIGGALAIEPASRGGVEVRLEVPLRQVVQPVGAPS